ncbi:hypothetical protein OHA77_13710 [Streptosporangium sp. NBC_01639]|uniref:hypothetical protein n=1 Tax=Streptosporangium sp. NBC_01639 TaxID=2975948 RepID=UPI0038691965|nr:hypothetical protein OHA77_13710 [Streptosporangium sp. NBC_01639]
MDALLFNLTTAALMVLMFTCARTLIGEDTIGLRRIPWAAAGLTAVALAGVVTQLCWHGAMAALDADPSKSGWWRGLTSIFMQNGGVVGTVWNIVTLAVIAALAEWFWSGPLMLVLFAAGAFLPQLIDVLLGATSGSADPRNFAGSSGATYFLAATLAAALLLRSRAPKERFLALGVPALGLALWFAQANGHGLVATYGFAIGAVAWGLGRHALRPERDLQQPPRRTMASLAAIVGKR